ncbi:hypothetical protein [Alienimonas californiensis]|uniref:Uncharacterized protein n=1 Tax=Alienimonas californiensis TaxID=2527989 RepID=A0A517P3T6_9PLAN|nr:hypothetical protein [Alienimonas californiensis]QDT14040.1 hypothetical protein CA12_01080 [Alienimonas californiensis]
MFAPAVLCLALFGGEYQSENAATGVQPPFAERAVQPFEPPTIAAAAAEALAPLDARDLEALRGHVGTVKAVRGRCTAAFVPEGGTVVVLNFAENYHEALTAPIFDDHFAKWPGGPAAMERAYIGKTLLVQGLVTEYRGAPQIKIAHPGQALVVE